MRASKTNFSDATLTPRLNDSSFRQNFNALDGSTAVSCAAFVFAGTG